MQQPNDLALLDAVYEVAAIANPTDPLRTSQRAFDDARARSLFHPDLPRAKRIAERLGMPWRDVLTVARVHDDERGRLLAAKTGRTRPAKWVTPENAASALAIIARRLNTNSLTQGQYRRERENMLADDAKRWMHGRQLRVPSAAQIVDALGSWDAALSAAGLQATPADRKHGPRWTQGTCVEAVARYLTQAGKHPTSGDYADWAAKHRNAPSQYTIGRFGGWPAVSREARDLLLERELGINAPRT
ncbi:MAG TPA: hypothetical protein VMU32_12720 [Solirubrobacteraceae bacterium]|nr:hypothetical protein [Solirubrobacteraceae bacterium]